MRIYNISTDTWSVGANRSGAYNNYSNAIGAFNGNIYVTGFAALSIYNIATNSWSEGPTPPPTAAYGNDWGGGYVQVGQYLYIVGGWNFFHFLEMSEFNSDVSRRLDMASDTWSIGPTWTVKRKEFALVAVGNKLLAIGGDRDYATSYDGSTEVDSLDTSAWPEGIWVKTPYDLPSPRVGNRAGFVSSARVGGEVWTTGGVLYNYTDGYSYTNEHLFLPTNITSSGSSIVAAGANGVLDRGNSYGIAGSSELWWSGLLVRKAL